MRALGPEDILHLSETGRVGAASQALAILARAEPGRDATRLGALSIGRRDAELLAVRTLTFGPQLNLYCKCPRCRAPVEFSLTAEEVGLTPARLADVVEPKTVPVAGHEVTLRPVSAGDLVAIETLDAPEAAGRVLLAHCVLAVDGAPPGDLETDFADAVETELARLDPAADIEIGLSCPDCRAEFAVLLDPLSLLISELRLEARRLLGDVAEIARVFHWSERDILAMTPQRRRFYLEAARS
jgi:hypothetical protein